MEEAGVKGSLRVSFLKLFKTKRLRKFCLSFCLVIFFQEVPLGVWEFRSKSSSCNEEDECYGGCKGYMFALEVTEELEEWPERENRERKWVI